MASAPKSPQESIFWLSRAVLSMFISPVVGIRSERLARNVQITMPLCKDHTCSLDRYPN
jgi:hypothetical protein